MRIRAIITVAFFSLCGEAHAGGSVPAVNQDMGCAASGQSLYYNGSSIACGSPSLQQSTVASLPTCNSAAKGAMYLATDALTPIALSGVTGGGAVIVPVVCNGTTWIVS